MKERYIYLLKSTMREGMDELIDWLENETDFFDAPASSKYHLSKEKGLLEHSLNVYDVLEKELGENSNSVKITALLHDICKANYYKVDYRNQKNNEGNWVKVPYYKIEDNFPMGHGEKSVILALRFIKLTNEEIAAIRWHMGLSETKDNYTYLNKAFSKYPLALMLHIADLKATYIKESE